MSNVPVPFPGTRGTRLRPSHFTLSHCSRGRTAALHVGVPRRRRKTHRSFPRTCCFCMHVVRSMTGLHRTGASQPCRKVERAWNLLAKTQPKTVSPAPGQRRRAIRATNRPAIKGRASRGQAFLFRLRSKRAKEGRRISASRSHLKAGFPKITGGGRELEKLETGKRELEAAGSNSNTSVRLQRLSFCIRSLSPEGLRAREESMISSSVKTGLSKTYTLKPHTCYERQVVCFASITWRFLWFSADINPFNLPLTRACSVHVERLVHCRLHQSSMGATAPPPC